MRRAVSQISSTAIKGSALVTAEQVKCQYPLFTTKENLVEIGYKYNTVQ